MTRPRMDEPRVKRFLNLSLTSIDATAGGRKSLFYKGFWPMSEIAEA